MQRVHPCRLQHIDHNNCETKDSKSNEHDNSNKTNGDNSSETNDNSIIPIVDSKTESRSNNSITLPDSQDTLNKNSKHSHQIPSPKLPKKSQEVKYRYANDPWQTVTILGPAGSRKRKYKNWVNVSNGVKSWLMNWLDATKWHPVNNDIIPNDNHEDNTLLPGAKKVLSNPLVDEFISTDSQPIEIENNEFIILLIMTISSYKLIMCI